MSVFTESTYDVKNMILSKMNSSSVSVKTFLIASSASCEGTSLDERKETIGRNVSLVTKRTSIHAFQLQHSLLDHQKGY